MNITLGNIAALDWELGPNGRVAVPLPGERTTTIVVDTEATSPAGVVELVRGVYNFHSSEPPVWVECDEPEIKRAICHIYGIDPKRRRPARWGDGSTTRKMMGMAEPEPHDQPLDQSETLTTEEHDHA